MAKYTEYKSLNLSQIDQDVLSFWQENEIFEKSISSRPEDNTFVFYEGPPSANGKPGIHHVMARTIKDIFCRFHTMQGERVTRKGGWDTHGLPIELSVEKELGITKEDIGKSISIAEYNQKCRETVMRYKDMWDDITVKMGYWVDLNDPYITFTNEYIESVWWLLKQMYDKDLIYKGYTVQPYSPAAGTGLSSHELNMPGAYQNIKDTSVTAQFKVTKNDKSSFLFEGHEDEVFIVAWTTTPWTLPSNCALAIGKKLEYSLVRTFNAYTKKPIAVVLATDLIPKHFKEKAAELSLADFDPEGKLIPFEIVKSFKGAELLDIKYEQLMPYVQPEEGEAFRVIHGDFVSTTDGTGIVHTASIFGADDFRVCKQNNVPSILVRRGKELRPLVDQQGKFVEEVTDFPGYYVKAEYYSKEEQAADGFLPTDVQIAIKLKEDNRAFKVEKYEHNYPHCWRTDKPILYYPLDSWFIKTSAHKEKMVELNNTINWKPKHTGEGRFGNWLENLQDWNLSRSRYWGVPLPIWRTANGEEEICIGSYAQLEAEIKKANEALGLTQELPDDPHRPYIDDVILVSDSGHEMKRELDLIDVWFDSGSMPFAQLHYPFNEDTKSMVDEGTFYPADFISEGVDQTRGWFYSLHAISALVTGSVAYKNVVSTGLVLDKNGVKMSKRLGNTIDPFEAIEKYGADAVRWYMISNAQPWDNLKFDLSGVEEVKRKFFGTLYNTYSFFALYANIDGFDYSQQAVPLSERQEIDRWIISLLHSLRTEVKESYADYEATNACRKIMTFVDQHLSNWYVRLCRRRFWKGEFTSDKIAAYQTLYECLETIAKLMAPVAPFFSEWLYRNLNTATGRQTDESVHLTLIEDGDSAIIDKALEERMDYAQRISSLVLSLRKKEKIRVRQPLQKILLPVLDANFQKQVEAVEDLVLAEVNVKGFDYVDDASGIIKKKIKPNFKTLGKRLGKDMKAGAAAINQLTDNDIIDIEKSGVYTLQIGDVSYELGMEDFEITSEDIPGWQVATDKDITVALDITLDDALLAEGMARELVNRIQNIRKTKEFNVTDRINITLEKHESIDAAIAQFSAYICEEVLADELTLSDSVSDETIDLGDDVTIGVQVTQVS
jgi:isoleucyl-tRNA synthetase